MRNILVVCILLLSVSVVNAQKMFEEQFSDCPLKFILEDDEYFINYSGGDSIMVQDFIEGLEEKQVEKLLGVVMFQIMLDTAMNICCVSYTNKTTLSDKKIDIPNRLKQMKSWERLSNCDPIENICALVSIVFDKKKITVIRTGYNRNKGRSIMQTITYKRYRDNLPMIQETEHK